MKTLKDLFPTNGHETCTHYAYDSAVVEKLKAAAVEWVKEIRKGKLDTKEWCDRIEEEDNVIGSFGLTCTDMEHLDMAAVWIKHFFNLTEEDLR